jgi:hypothetical protein
MRRQIAFDARIQWVSAPDFFILREGQGLGISHMHDAVGFASIQAAARQGCNSPQPTSSSA